MIRGFLALILLSIIALIGLNYLSDTEVIPNYGGKYTEGIIGQPRFINPVIAQTNDADRDLVQLVYSGLLKYDGQGNLIEDLAESYSVDDNVLNYEFVIRQDAFWHDGEKVTADDVIFTIQTIQNHEFKSPIRVNWQGVVAEKIDDLTVRFVLRNTYAPFLHNTVVGILPKHLWQGISTANFPLAEYNQSPIGSGPYRFSKLENDQLGKIEQIELVSNENYYHAENSQVNSLSKPYIEKIVLKFYENELAAIEALNSNDVDGISFVSAANLKLLKERKLNVHKISLPRYYAVFFNQSKSKPLSDKNVRLALNFATNKDKIVAEVLNGDGMAIDSPILPGSLGFSADLTKYSYNLAEAKNILDESDWLDSDEDGIREKKINGDIALLEIDLLTVNWPELVSTAQVLKNDWENIGAKINLQIVDPASINADYIRPRQYQALLFGEIFGADPDPFAFWHSSLKKDPGLNLALYNSKKVDKILEEARQTLDQQIRAAKYLEFQELVIADLPAIFLYSPSYLYPVKSKIRGIDIQKLALQPYRFSQIEHWFIKTARIEK